MSQFRGKKSLVPEWVWKTLDPFRVPVAVSKSEGMSTGIGGDGGFAVPPEEKSSTPTIPEPQEVNAYGNCPHCGQPGQMRERRPDGNDTCVNGHVYRSRLAVMERPESVTKSSTPTVEDFETPTDGKGYGLCPLCGADAISRERRVDGNTSCADGHVFPTKMTTPYPEESAEETSDTKEPGSPESEAIEPVMKAEPEVPNVDEPLSEQNESVPEPKTEQ